MMMAGPNSCKTSNHADSRTEWWKRETNNRPDASQVASNPKGPVAQAIQQLAVQKANGNTDQVNQAATQIGQQVAKVTTSNQVLVQVSNQGDQ